MIAIKWKRMKLIYVLSLSVVMVILWYSFMSDVMPAIKCIIAEVPVPPEPFDEFAEAFSDEDVSLMRELLLEFTQTLENASILYFMVGGTLLGSYRHHGRIPWDDDADFVVNSTDKDKLVQLFENSTDCTFLNADGGRNHWKLFPKHGRATVSYTHLTLPTKRIV